MKETKTLEFKRELSNSFLKTVSAFANYSGGTVLFGVDDAGATVGIANPTEVCLAIEHKINDSISPSPDYSLAVRAADSVIELSVEPGVAKPYLYRSKAYTRHDTATVEVDRTELTRLILAGKNLSFEELPSEADNLRFTRLADEMKAHLRLAEFGKDALKTLGLLSVEGVCNNAAALLADENVFPGIDIAQFGESINVILRRVTSERVSILVELDEALAVFEDCYCYEEVRGFRRERVERIPHEAFREVIANALVHRTWDVSAHIRVSMHPDRVEVASPGGLPAGITECEFLHDAVSVRRNPLIAGVFHRLGIIEAFGTGILRIKQAYAESASKPEFVVSENVVSVTLPVLKRELDLSADEQLVYDLLSPVRAQASSAIHAQVPFSRTKLNTILKGLVARGLAQTSGANRGLKYRRL